MRQLCLASFWQGDTSFRLAVLTMVVILFFQIDHFPDFVSMGPSKIGMNFPARHVARIFGFILKTKPRTFEIRTQLGQSHLGILVFVQQRLWNRFCQQKYILYRHLSSFLPAGVLGDNISLGSFVFSFLNSRLPEWFQFCAT